MPTETSFEFLGMPAVIVSPAMQEVLARARAFAASGATVLIEGESGVGKELIARAIHHFSGRASRPWVDISCAALPDNLVESELFGYEKGAFSGADARKPGLFELAENGTIFLDEIGELDQKLQSKLLRVLDASEFYRLGGTKKVRLDVRPIAATNANLKRMITEGTFRADLYHRLAQLRIQVPPLRERVEDVLPLARFFCERYQLEAAFSPAAQAALRTYSWPGNVRELRNVVLQSAVVAGGREIGLLDLPLEVAATATGATASTCDLMHLSVSAGGGMIESAERRLILEALQQTKGHQGQAAQILGISSRTLSRRIKTLHIGGLAGAAAREGAR